MIDLHTHTNASDGRCSPSELVARARQGGVQVLSVTDHDTVGAAEEAAAACAHASVEFVCGIEITAVADDVDIHVLGYFIDPRSSSLATFLTSQRQQRIERLREVVALLATHGIQLDADAILQPAIDNPQRAAGRPWVGRALIAGGYVADMNDAFDKWLAHGKPGFVPRAGAPPAEVFSVIHEAGGVASLAHPGSVGRDHLIPGFASTSLDALEAYHSDHEPADTARYLDMARSLGLLVSGGSDYHGDDSHGGLPGSVSLPREEFDRLRRRARG